MARKPALGKGLDALLKPASELGQGSDSVASAVEELELDRIYPSSVQPRTTFDQEGLEQLEASIKSQGVMQPVVVRPRPAGGFELVAGERRWRAAQGAGLARVPAIVRDMDDPMAMTLALVENLQREDLNPMDEAQALDRLSNEFGMTHEVIAKAIGKSRAAISNLLRLLRLEPAVANLLRDGRIDRGHAKVLLSVTGKKQMKLAQQTVQKGLSVRALESLVSRQGQEPTKRHEKADGRESDPHVLRLERELSDELGTTVVLRSSKGARKGNQGELVIKYHSLDELNGLVSRIRSRDA